MPICYNYMYVVGVCLDSIVALSFFYQTTTLGTPMPGLDRLIFVEQWQVVISASIDCSVRVWSRDGKHIGQNFLAANGSGFS